MKIHFVHLKINITILAICHTYNKCKWMQVNGLERDINKIIQKILYTRL